MLRIVGLVATGIGAMLLYYGIQASQSVGSQVKEFVTGTPTDNSMMLIIAGAAIVIIGLGVVVMGNKAK